MKFVKLQHSSTISWFYFFCHEFCHASSTVAGERRCREGDERIIVAEEAEYIKLVFMK